MRSDELLILSVADREEIEQKGCECDHDNELRDEVIKHGLA